MPEDLPQDRPLDREWLARHVEMFLDEDLGGSPGRDVTTQATISRHTVVNGDVVVRVDGVIAGLDVLDEVVAQVAARLGLDAPMVTMLASDGDRVTAGTAVARINGLGHVVLIAERTVLNLMSRASGIATHTRRWADALQGRRLGCSTLARPPQVCVNSTSTQSDVEAASTSVSVCTTAPWSRTTTSWRLALSRAR